jgi:hypothetical protein
MSLSSARSSQWLVLSFLASVSFLATTGCGGRSGIGTGDDPDGGGSAGVLGTAGGSGDAGSGAAGATGGSGAAGATGGSGAAGASPTGQAGAGGNCGAVCEIYCPWGNVKDASGCPLCKCNPAPACQPTDCGAPIPTPPACTSTCARNDGGKCAWTTSCSACATGIACTTKCAYGYQTDANGCLTCLCNPAPTCAPKDCGPAPGAPSMMCSDGSVAGPVCGPTSAGTCGWTITKCPPVVCPAIACLRACPNGSRPDAKGCPTCDCIETACGTHADYKTCSSDMQCQWLQPGCGQPALATGGCFSHTDVGCASDASCSGGRQCLKRVVDPCYNPLSSVRCDACGLTQTVCL